VIVLLSTAVVPMPGVGADSLSAAGQVAEDLWVTYSGFDGPGRGKHIVLVSGDEEYRSEEGLSQLGKILAKHHGFRCTLLFAVDPSTGLVNPNYQSNIPGLGALRTADLMIIATRFRDLPDDQMQYIDSYLKSGGPIIGMRTATHAFKISPNRKRWLHYDYRYNGSNGWKHYDKRFEGERKEWKGGFGGLVLGDTWFYHHGHHNHQSTRGMLASAAQEHAIGRGLKHGEIWGPTDVYAVRLPLARGSLPLVLGRVMDRSGKYDEQDPFLGMRPTDDQPATTGHNPTADRGDDRYDPNDPMLPVAWTKAYQVAGGRRGRVFATTMGASTDLVAEGTRRLLVNAVYWCVSLSAKIPPGGTKVDLVGDYEPTAYRFHSNDYWKRRALRPSAFKMKRTE
jgi:hypothetical protein